ncbi:MAG: peptidyl-prolyl cis-trans isomerase [Syntrophaceae bacterium]
MNYLSKIAFVKVYLLYHLLIQGINKILPCCVCAAYILTLCGCQENITSKPLATVDGMEITYGEFRENFVKELNVFSDGTSVSPEDMERLKEEVLNSLINEKVMLLRAQALSLSVSDEELMKKIEEIKENYSDEGFEKIFAAQKVNYSAWKKELRKRMVFEKLIAADVNTAVTVTENEARAYYRNHKKMYAPGKRVHAVQIIVREREKAEAILNRLKKGDDFGKVAKEESIGPEAVKGGDLGFVSQGVMPEEIDDALFSLKPDEISSVIKSPYGYHIVKIIEREKDSRKMWRDVREQILIDVRKQKEEKAYVLWIEALKSKATITIDRDTLKK